MAEPGDALKSPVGREFESYFLGGDCVIADVRTLSDVNHDFIIKATNRVAIYATGALIYWLFVFSRLRSFDLKIFRERMTEIFSSKYPRHLRHSERRHHS
ncbi:MAG: hypothetical protein IPO77_22730 [Acidobacteria bacterium]|nr:hypothetical protein [Acidobacteriota bacterium]